MSPPPAATWDDGFSNCADHAQRKRAITFSTLLIHPKFRVWDYVDSKASSK
jgi:hypothetical protein